MKRPDVSGRATFYHILDLPPTAAAVDVRHACRRLSLACHADMFITHKERATGAYKRVQQVRDTLCDPER